MPFKGTSRYTTDRELEAIVNAEDSNDEDYDDREPRKPRLKQSVKVRRGGSALPRKRQRRVGYGGSDISDEEIDASEEEDWTEESEPEEVEINPQTGRPRRSAAKVTKTYEESDEELDVIPSSSADEALVTPRKGQAAAKRSKVVTLKVRTPLPPTRSLRDRRSSMSSKPQSVPTRRTRRMSEEAGEDLFELSNSGRHTVVVRAGSHDQEIPAARATRGSKSIKYPSKSTIDEDDEPESPREEEEEEEEEEEDDDNDYRHYSRIEIPSSQHMEEDVEIPASQEHDLPEMIPQLMSDVRPADELDMAFPSEDPLHLSPVRPDPRRPEIEPLSDLGEAEEDDDEGPVMTRGRTTRASQKRKADSPAPDEPPPGRRRLRPRSAQGEPSTSRRRRGIDETSDFDPDKEVEEPEDVSDSVESDASPRKRQRQDDYDSSNGGRRSTRLRQKAVSRRASGSEGEDLAGELAEELAELRKDGSKRKRSAQADLIFEARGRRNAGRKNYDLLRNLPQIDEDDEPAAPTPSQRGKRGGGGGWQRTIHSTYGPFGGAGGRSLFGGPGKPPEADSDSSDDEVMKRPRPLGGTVGMTPTTATNPFNPFAVQPLNSDPAQGPAGTPANLGKIKDKQALADADPLGVDQNVDFDSVGGLQGHIDQLKEMVALPLLYPEIFMRFKITPPRGVLFHGPPGTGKTLLARALATSVSSQGRKVTFYMRKGADALSKWVGEAERQLRMLFEEARKNQPSIIFFDEIDGLAPVRSSKQEQIHASIVSTLLALMDGMDGRGQVIVIGATNRPDSIDPALRRPGRFDREFYFPLPDIEARRAIIQINTKNWNPPLDDRIKDELAMLTKGYGGADLRALCTEAALNAVQRRYPQIYASKEKLLIDPKTITVTPKDFMISIKKMTPSSERSASSGAAPLPSGIAPLLTRAVDEIKALIAEILPQKRKTTALEEAQFEDVADGTDFGRERMQQAFESSRVFRPRLLINGKVGMGQQYVAAALLNHFQGIHVQSFDLATLLSDTTSSAEATVIRLFTEVKMHKPSVIYIPNVQEWYNTVGPTVLTTFFGLLRAIKPTDPILVMGFIEDDSDQEDHGMKKELFGYSQRNQYILDSPRKQERQDYFEPLKDYIKTKPSDFPDPTQRKKRHMEILPPAPPEPAKGPAPLSKEELKAQKKRDRQTLNMLKIRLQPIMDQIRTRYKKFRTGVIEESAIRYLYDEADPATVTSDVQNMQMLSNLRPFEVGKDPHGVPGLVEQSTGKFFYNLDSVTIEKRLSNGYYRRPKDYLADIKRLAKDAKAIEDEDRLLKANELLANVEVDVAGIELNEPALAAECEKVYQRELQREKEAEAKERGEPPMPPPTSQGDQSEPTATTTTEGTGQIRLGEGFSDPKAMLGKANPVTPSRMPSNSSVVTNGWHDTTTHTDNQPDPEQSGSGHEADAENDTPMQDSNVNSTSKTSGETQNTHTSETTSSFGRRDSAQPRPFYMHTAPSQQLRREHGMAQQLSQTGYITPMQPGSQAADYVNEASTTQTTSGRKNTSDPSSGNRDEENTQETGPNLFIFDENRSAGGTDIPDTQPTQGMLTRRSLSDSSALTIPTQIVPTTLAQRRCTRRTRQLRDNRTARSPYLTKWSSDNPPLSQSSANGSSNDPSSQYVSAAARPQPASGSQPPLVPPIGTPSDATGSAPGPISRTYASGTHAISNMLNPPSPPPTSQPAELRSFNSHRTSSEPKPNLILPSDSSLNNTLLDLTDKTSGLSVEQLEQVNSVLMDVLWKTRGEWDRRVALDHVVEGFNRVLADMRQVGQEFGELSWGGNGVGTTRRIEG